VARVEGNRARADRAGAREIARLAEAVPARRERVAERRARAPPDRDDAPAGLDREIGGPHVRVAAIEQLALAEAMARPRDGDPDRSHPAARGLLEPLDRARSVGTDRDTRGVRGRGEAQRGPELARRRTGPDLDGDPVVDEPLPRDDRRALGVDGELGE